jgi:rod shape-determining protein MreB
LTNVGIIKKGVVVENDTLQIGTDLFNADIYKYLIKNRNIICSRNDIEKIRLEVGAVTEINHDKPPEDIYIQGIHVDTLKLIQEQISYLELIEPLKHTVIKIAELAKKVSLYSTNNDSIVDIGRSGIYLIGVGSMLRGLDHLISIETDLAVYIGEEPIRTIVRGLGIIANDIDKTHPDTSKYVDYSIINKF